MRPRFHLRAWSPRHCVADKCQGFIAGFIDIQLNEVTRFLKFPAQQLLLLIDCKPKSIFFREELSLLFV